MIAIQLDSASSWHLDTARAGVLAVRLAEFMGLYQRQPGERIDRGVVAAVIDASARAGIAEQVAARPDAADPGAATVFALLDALVASPRPREEIVSLAAILGYERLGRLVSAAEPSLRRYAAGSRPTPDAVAGRVHYLAQVVAVLRGSFNEFGIRRWFERPHPALDGRAPETVIGAGFDPDAPGPRLAMDAALALLG